MFRHKKKNKNWQKKNHRLYRGVPKRGQREKRGRASRFIFWFLFLIFLAVSLYILFFSTQLDIDTVIVEGNQNILTADITDKVNAALNGKYYKYLSKRNFFFASKSEIARTLEGGFSRLEVSEVEKKFPKTIFVRVKERQPELIWCSGGVCYLVDKEGLIYSGVNGTEGDLKNNNQLAIIDDNAKPVDIGLTRIDQSFIDYLKEIDVVLTDDLHFNLGDSYHTPALASQEIYARIAEPDSDGWTLKLSSNISPPDTKKIIETILEKDINNNQLKSLDYLDLSVKGKVYYKMKS